MLVLAPQLVRFDSLEWTDVSLIAIDRTAARQALEWSDLGPHPTFADVPEQRTTIRIIRQLDRGDLAAPAPGRAGELVFDVSPAATEAGRRTHTAQCVVLSIRHELSAGPKGHAAVQTIELIALSGDGAADPFTASE
ncbi:MAG: hypothetical protein KF869_01310 [Phycisphaeraceae bacterium]|nr:hypothetical protein [Phycisphaeraceae bacterium]